MPVCAAVCVLMRLKIAVLTSTDGGWSNTMARLNCTTDTEAGGGVSPVTAPDTVTLKVVGATVGL